jgi:2-oxoglutarate dehydrogenase E1 component
MNAWEAFYGPNVGYALELYERYLLDPGSVDEATRAFFDSVGPLRDGESAIATLTRPTSRTRQAEPNGKRLDTEATEVVSRRKIVPSTSAPGETLDDASIQRIVRAARLARGIRECGHLDARIDPLGAKRPGDPMLDPATHELTETDLRSLPATIVWPGSDPEAGTFSEAIKRLRDIYSGSIGFEFDQVQDFTERAWLHTCVESGAYRAPFSADQKRALLSRLTEVEGFERFLHTIYQGQKRFSIEGNDTLVPMLDEVVVRAREAGTREILVGMAHRGRLNVLAHMLGKPYGAIFREFHSAAKREDSAPEDHGSWTGDVKYHLGWRREQGGVQITLADNPSHLEFVNPVVEGFARAAQDVRDHPGAPGQDISRALPIIIHGDAAFPGEGVVAETLNLSRLDGYQTGGTIHLIVNNQIGFTTRADQGRSTLYASDLAKGFEIPILHVNADDPEACVHAIKFAWAYMARFHRDVLVDLVGYRRWGHNEGDEPAFTQPRLYAEIGKHATVRALYAERLAREDVVTSDEAETMRKEVLDRLRQARDAAEAGDEGEDESQYEALPKRQEHLPLSEDRLRELNDAILGHPEEFTPNPKLVRLMKRRREAIDQPGGVDWALAEILAFATILEDATPIRLTGQDTERGTFSQRHLVLHDTETGLEYVPLQSIPQARASFAIYNSPLAEAAVLGFEYGYSVHASEALVLWEAQFGDFANVGQVLIDQFIAAARAKWQRRPALGMLLPHGYEGQGPEHSSARLERFLQLSAEDNMRICNCTTAAQYFHLLRLQAESLSDDRRPLVIVTPKSLLRHPRSASSLQDLAHGAFQAVLVEDAGKPHPDRVERLILCSGKIAVELAVTGLEEATEWAAVARVEQLYPFPREALTRTAAGHPNLREVVWLQEEPRNMGAWGYMEPKLRALIGPDVALRYIGRTERASTAEGSADVHAWEQKRIVNEAFTRAPKAEIGKRQDRTRRSRPDGAPSERPTYSARPPNRKPPHQPGAKS